ncbi:hypothetical protein K431DRAFT_72922 [Polychaeton citri CBS 116435]|uniref:Uncharacterized protein n=1 Tax=Polychaeton citri CBS 116435 TaxID=1314669 RepID=A0A9P4Q7Q6_9PEZI|nr:hypothetical protein K431DRAFT_72922 [Polychaeton citri CBS 116435]
MLPLQPTPVELGKPSRYVRSPTSNNANHPRPTYENTHETRTVSKAGRAPDFHRGKIVIKATFPRPIRAFSHYHFHAPGLPQGAEITAMDGDWSRKTPTRVRRVCMHTYLLTYAPASIKAFLPCRLAPSSSRLENKTPI